MKKYRDEKSGLEVFEIEKGDLDFTTSYKDNLYDPNKEKKVSRIYRFNGAVYPIVICPGKIMVYKKNGTKYEKHHVQYYPSEIFIIDWMSGTNKTNKYSIKDIYLRNTDKLNEFFDFTFHDWMNDFNASNLINNHEFLHWGYSFLEVRDDSSFYLKYEIKEKDVNQIILEKKRLFNKYSIELFESYQIRFMDRFSKLRKEYKENFVASVKCHINELLENPIYEINQIMRECLLTLGLNVSKEDVEKYYMHFQYFFIYGNHLDYIDIPGINANGNQKYKNINVRTFALSKFLNYLNKKWQDVDDISKKIIDFVDEYKSCMEPSKGGDVLTTFNFVSNEIKNNSINKSDDKIRWSYTKGKHNNIEPLIKFYEDYIGLRKSELLKDKGLQEVIASYFIYGNSIEKSKPLLSSRIRDNL